MNATTPRNDTRRATGARLMSRRTPSMVGQLIEALRAIFWQWSWQRRAYPIAPACIVATKDGATVRGVLVHEARHHVIIARCEVADVGATALTPIDGDMLVYVENIKYIQLL